MNLTVETSLKRRVKAQAALLGRTVSDVVSELLEKWLKEVEAQPEDEKH